MQSEVKKTRFKFNFFDILILALLLFVIVFSVYLAVMTENKSSYESEDGFRYILRGEQINNEFIPMISLGEVIYEAESGVELGSVVDITVTDYTESYYDGELLKTKVVEGYSNIEITVDCFGASYVDEDGIINVHSNGFSVRVGTDIEVRNTKFIFVAECLLPEKAEAKK